MKKKKTYNVKIFDLVVFLLVILVFGFVIYSGVVAHPGVSEVSDLGPEQLVSGGTFTPSEKGGDQPLFRFDISGGSGTTQYEIQIDDSSDFSSPVVDYVSDELVMDEFLGSRIATTHRYTLGQEAPGIAHYILGEADMSLADGSYYWQVRAMDTEDGEEGKPGLTRSGSYVVANDGEIAFIIGEQKEEDPGISNVQFEAGSDYLTITWDTPEETTSSEVAYGPNEDIEYSADSSSKGEQASLHHSTTINDLLACSLYFYLPRYEPTSQGAEELLSEGDTGGVLGESMEGSEGMDVLGDGSLLASGVYSAYTKGCLGAAEVTKSAYTKATAISGGSVELQETKANNRVTLSIPVNFKGLSEASIQVKQLDSAAVLDSFAVPSGKKALGGGRSYDFKALETAEDSITMFDNAITVTADYSDDDIEGLDESTLAIYRWNGSSWIKLSNCSVNTESDVITCETSHFSTFTILGEETGSGTTGGDTGGTTGGGSVSGSGGGAVIINKPSTPSSGSSTPSTASSSTMIFTRTLSLSSTGEDVRALQIYLNAHGYPVSASGNGASGSETTYFGTKTKLALKLFQETNAQFILKPYGLTKGTGILGAKSREYINAHQ